jgi:hypothetical protein
MNEQIHSQIDAFQDKYDYDMDYARQVVAVDPELYARFFQATQLAGYEGGIGRAAHWAVRALGTMAGDCGPCLQLSVQMGEEQGVDKEVMRAVLGGELGLLSGDTRLCAEFAQALLRRSPTLPELREKVVTRLGNQAAIAIAFALIVSNMYPTLKYALGHGHTCSPVSLAGERVAVDRSVARPTAE